ncbi:protein kinase [Streptomyces noboritoensis]|uniref:non-specific serine/threonine protein kinase n=1 Tax=Streptomyces noboritoensis TaxID=67337 RepID=A0ABV6TC43_9ACTN
MWDGAAADGPGRLIAGRYRLLEQIGRGGMGTVWRVEDELLGRHVALKKVHFPPHLGEDERATLHERTRREARSAARITHRNVVVVHDVVEDAGLPCIVMEYVPSRTLGDVLKNDGPVDPGEAARIGRAMIAALRAAHAAGVLHRDVKPANVLLGADGRVVLTDFGIAIASGTSTLTRTGELVGSIDYCAPERVKGAPPGPAGDLWALGATLYQAVEGRPPFRRSTPIETAYAIVADPLEPPRHGGPLAPLITQLLAKEPEDRPTAEAVQARLRESARPHTPAPDPAERAARTEPAAPGPDRPGTAATALLSPGAGEDTTARGRTGRRTVAWAAVAAVLAVAALGGTYLALHDSGRSAASSAPSPSTSASKTTEPPVPKGYRLVEEKAFGLAFPVPDGWTRKKLEDDAEGVAYIDPTGMASLRIAALDFASTDPLQRWKDDEARSIKQGKLPGYRQLRMQSTTYQQRPAAIWEFTWQGRARQWRAVDLGFGKPGGTEYAIYLSAPAADWDRYKPVFDHVRDGFRLPGQAR